MEQKEGRFEPSFGHLYPVMLSLGITGALGYPLASQGVQTPSALPFQGNTYSGASLNALLFVIALGGSATFMFLLVRKGRMGFLQKMVKAALVIVCFSVAIWYGSIVFAVFGGPPDPGGTLLLFEVSAGAATFLGLMVFGKNQARQLIGATLVSALTGLFLGASIPTLTALILAGALVVYDFIAVFRGPIGALAKRMEVGDLPGAVFNYRDLSIGMGDLVFYSLVATAALWYTGPSWYYGPVQFLSAGGGILAGAFLGFKALRKYEMFPGLPFAMILGIGGLLLSRLLLSLFLLGTPTVPLLQPGF